MRPGRERYPMPPLHPDEDPSLGQALPPRDHPVARPEQAEAEEAVRVLLRWAGENPNREGLLDTPARVARSYRELFAGYDTDPRQYLERVFEEVAFVRNTLLRPAQVAIVRDILLPSLMPSKPVSMCHPSMI